MLYIRCIITAQNTQPTRSALQNARCQPRAPRACEIIFCNLAEKTDDGTERHLVDAGAEAGEMKKAWPEYVRRDEQTHTELKSHDKQLCVFLPTGVKI